MDFPGCPVVYPPFPLQRLWVRSLVRELRSHMLHAQLKKRGGERENKYLKKTKRIFLNSDFNGSNILRNFQDYRLQTDYI